MRFFFLFLLLFSACGPSNGEKKHYLKIATGSQTGLYYTLGTILSDLFNQESEKFDLAVESSSGSVFNINAALSMEVDFAFCQADREYQAYHGLGEWDKKAQKDLRFICSFHTETVNLIASKQSQIQSLQDLKGKKVSIGPFGSGTRGSALSCLKAAGIDTDTLFLEQLNITSSSMMLQDGRIDAFFYTVGHPNGALSESTNGQKQVVFIPLEKLDLLIQKEPYYFKAIIPTQFYPKALNQQKVKTIGMKTTCVASKDLDDKIVYLFTKTIFEKLEKLKKTHPSLEGLIQKEMLLPRNIPLHKGALTYYKEIGLIQ